MTLPTSIRAVVFDVDGTLYHQARLRRAMAVRLVAAHALHPRRGRRVLRALSAYRHAQEALRDANGPDLALQQIDMAARVSGVPVAEVRSIVEQWMETAPLPLLTRVARKHLRSTLERLRKHGLVLAVLSDYPAESKLQALGIADLFDVVLCAQDPSVGVFKPHPRGLEFVLVQLGVAASEALYVGDRADIDAAAAAAAGVACVIVDSQSTAPTPDFISLAHFNELGALLGAPE